MLGGGKGGSQAPGRALTMMPRWLPLHGLLLGAALVLLACQGSPDDDPTDGTNAIPPPAQTPVQEESGVTSEPENEPPVAPSTTSTVRPPAPTGPLSNLRPTIPEGWRSPLIIASEADAPASTVLSEGGPVYVSWAMSNNGLTAATRFFVDLYLDGVPVERFEAREGLQRGDNRVLQDWSDLLVRARLTPGEHELRVVVDSTNLVPESDESDNSYTVTFNWPEGVASVRPPTAPARLPNLAPFTPPGWSSPIRIAGPSGGGALTVEVAYRNEGLSSIGQLVQVYLYVDGILAAKFRERDLIAGEGVLTEPWSGLTQVIRLSPGPHTFTLTTDPTDLVLEPNEADNSFSVQMVWEASSVPSQTTSADTEPRGPARYASLTPPGWDGPIVVTADRGKLTSTAPLPTSGTVYVHWALRNPGSQNLSQPYTVELALDGRVVGRWNRLSLDAGAVDFVMDWPLPTSVSPGPHRLALTVRQQGGAGAELFPLGQRTFDWTVRTPASMSIRYTDNEIRASLRRLEGLLSSNAAGLGTQSPTAVEDVIAVVDAVYYTLYGVSMADEPLDIHVLSDESYTLWGDIQCQDTLDTISANVRPSVEESCARLEGFSGFTAQWRGQHHIVAHSERPPVQVLATLAHELGHFRQAVTNPDLDREAPSHAYRSFREAQAYAYQVFFFRTLESLTAQDLLVYPLLHGYESYVNQHLEGWASSIGNSEHSLGRLVLWMALLTDPELRRARTVLLDNRYLTAEAALEVFEYLVSFSAEEVEGYVAKLLQGVQTQLPAVQAVATSRLISGLPYWNEGSPHLREVGLLLP